MRSAALLRSPPGVWLAARVAALILGTMLVYAPSTQGDYLWDDDDNVTQNRLLRGEGQLWRIWTLWRQAGQGRITEAYQYYPLTFSSYWLQRKLAGALTPATSHWINVLLHATCAALLFALCRRLALPGAWLAAAVFAVHPVCVESVAWISERKNVLAGVFYLSALWAYARFDREAWRPGWPLAFACFALAALAKTHAVVLPAVLVVYLSWQRRRWTLPRLAGLAPFFAVSAALSLVTVSFEAGHVARGSGEWEWESSMATRVAIAGRIVWFYFRELVWPHPLMFVYPRWEVDPTQLTAWLPVLGLAALAALCWRRRAGWGWDALHAMAYYLVALAPVLGLIRVYFMRYAYAQDHFQYLASMGMLPALVAAGVVGWRRHPRLPNTAGVTIATATLAALGTLNWRHQADFRDHETLWMRTLEKNPDAAIAYVNLGYLYAARGETARAIELFERSLDLVEYAATHNNLGTALRAIDRLEEALPHYRRAVALQPYEPMLRFNLANACYARGDIACAIEQYRAALLIDPNFEEARRNLRFVVRENRSEPAAGTPASRGGDGTAEQR